MSLRNAAKGKPCMVRLPGICNGNPETTVLAHIRIAGTCGVGMKPPDTQATYACSACHDAIDGRVQQGFDRDFLEHAALLGMVRTQYDLFKNGWRMRKC